MTEEEITKVVIKLVGNIQPLGSTEYDNFVRDNINLMSVVIRGLIFHVWNEASKGNPNLASVARCRDTMMEMLKGIKEDIEEYLEEGDKE